MRDDERASAAHRGYDRKWRKLRAAKLSADPLCEHCKPRGRIVPAVDVDHIREIHGRHDPGRLRWDNLQSLCKACHARKTHGKNQGCDENGNPLDGDHWWNG